MTDLIFHLLSMLEDSDIRHYEETDRQPAHINIEIPYPVLTALNRALKEAIADVTEGVEK